MNRYQSLTEAITYYSHCSPLRKAKLTAAALTKIFLFHSGGRTVLVIRISLSYSGSRTVLVIRISLSNSGGRTVLDLKNIPFL